MIVPCNCLSAGKKSKQGPVRARPPSLPSLPGMWRRRAARMALGKEGAIQRGLLGERCVQQGVDVSVHAPKGLNSAPSFGESLHENRV